MWLARGRATHPVFARRKANHNFGNKSTLKV